MTGAEDKSLRTLEAMAACRGLVAVKTTAGNIVISRASASWIFDTVEIAAAWLDAIELKVPA